MKFCLEMKLVNNFEKFSAVLLSTGDKPIVEYSKSDQLWGAVDMGDYYEGTNALGRLLMELRQKTKSNPDDFRIEAPTIDNLKVKDIDLKRLCPIIYINH